MTTTNNPIATRTIAAVNRRWTITVGVALGIGAATLAASAAQGGSEPVHQVDPIPVYAELAPLAQWATEQGLSGLSPASLRPASD
jgi:hypothetical protein